MFLGISDNNIYMLLLVPLTGGIQTFLRAVPGPGESAEARKLYSWKFNVISFYIMTVSHTYSHCKVFCPVGRALIFVKGCERSCCHMLVLIFGYAIFHLLCCCNDSEEKMCCVEFTEWIK